tara:strand:- start:34774 stop:35544 length:771 start_codon:yes stop_codon:yes gene_type:complete
MLKNILNFKSLRKNCKYIIFGLICLILYLLFHEKIIKKLKIKYLHYTLLDILEKSIKIFDKHNINYWAIGGTLLGSIREGKIIDHDDDIDLSIDYKDKIKIKNNTNNILNDFEYVGLHIAFYVSDINYDHVFKIFKKNKNYPKHLEYGKNNAITNEYSNYIFIDVFPFKMNNNKYTYTYEPHRESWPKSYFLDGEIFPLKKNKLNNVEISVPNKSVLFLERFFGDCKNNNECWKIPKVTHSHLDEINISLYDILFN